MTVDIPWNKRIERAYWLKQQIKAMESEVAELLDFIEDDEVDVPAGDYIVQVRHNRRFDAATAKRNLTPEEYAAILVPKPDSTLAKKVLGANGYAATQADYGWKKTIVPVEDADG
jgi:hypothetical protein